MRAQTSRSLWGGLIAMAMMVSALSPVAIQVAKADTPGLIISEINWAGSANNPNDQWVELYNPTAGSAINFAATPYRLLANHVDVANLSSGTIQPGGYVLISRLGVSSPSLKTTVAGIADAALVLPTTNQQLELDDNNGTPVDMAGDGLSALPFVGTASSSTTVAASMERVGVLTDGTLPASWKTSQTTGVNFVSNVTQYGTPETGTIVTALDTNPNPELASPSSSDWIIASTAVDGSNGMPTVSGKFVANQPGEAIPVVATLTATSLINESQVATASVTINPDDTFSGTLSALDSSMPGIYRLTLSYSDSATPLIGTNTITVPITGSVQNVYRVTSPAPVTSIAKPVVTNVATCVTGNGLTDSTLCYTSDMSVSVSGTVGSNAAVVVYINGIPAVPVSVSGLAFATPPIPLVENSTNRIEIRAMSPDGTYSDPSVVTVVNDTKDPMLDSGLIQPKSNPPKTDDLIVGLAGAVTDLNPTTVSVYSDQGLINQIGATATVMPDGSFASIDIGDNLYATVYLVAKDAAGKVSNKLVLSNAITNASTTQFAVTGITQTQANLTVAPVTGATEYMMKYKVGTGAYSDPVQECIGLTTTNCVITLSLTPNTGYSVSVASVDQYGNIGAYTEKTFSSLAPVVAVATPAPTIATPAPIPVVTAIQVPVATYAPVEAAPVATPTPEPTVTPSPSASPEVGQVAAAEDTSSRNYTPWIILAILIGLAVLATAGYFYWFGGEADDLAMAPAGNLASVGDSKPTDVVPPTPKPVKETAKAPPEVQEQAPPPKKDKEKRW